MGFSMQEGDRLDPGQGITSNDGRFLFYVTKTNPAIARLYRFEVGKDPIIMDQYVCGFDEFHPGWVEMFHGRLMGVYAVHADGSRDVVWAFPFEQPAKNPILILQDDGNLVLYNRNADDEGDGAAWSTDTAGSYNNSYDPSTDIATIHVGTIDVNANCTLQNQVDSKITVCDGTQAVGLETGQYTGLNVPGGAGDVKIDVSGAVSYDLDSGHNNEDANPVNTTVVVDGNTITIKPGTYQPLDWSQITHDNFSNLPLYSTVIRRFKRLTVLPDGSLKHRP